MCANNQFVLTHVVAWFYIIALYFQSLLVEKRNED